MSDPKSLLVSSDLFPSTTLHLEENGRLVSILRWILEADLFPALYVNRSCFDWFLHCVHNTGRGGLCPLSGDLPPLWLLLSSAPHTPSAALHTRQVTPAGQNGVLLQKVQTSASAVLAHRGDQAQDPSSAGRGWHTLPVLQLYLSQL